MALLNIIRLGSVGRQLTRIADSLDLIAELMRLEGARSGLWVPNKGKIVDDPATESDVMYTNDEERALDELRTTLAAFRGEE